MLDFDSDAGTHGQFRPPTADRQMLLAMERSDVYVLKPAAPQRPWELYRNMLPDVPQQGQNAPGSQLCVICVIVPHSQRPTKGNGRTMLKAHLANIRSTSGLPRLDPFSLYVEGIGKRRGE